MLRDNQVTKYGIYIYYDISLYCFVHLVKYQPLQIYKTITLKTKKLDVLGL